MHVDIKNLQNWEIKKQFRGSFGSNITSEIYIREINLLNFAWLRANQIALTELLIAYRKTTLQNGDQERLSSNQK
jgi:hypothetical protein